MSARLTAVAFTFIKHSWSEAITGSGTEALMNPLESLGLTIIAFINREEKVREGKLYLIICLLI